MILLQLVRSRDFTFFLFLTNHLLLVMMLIIIMDEVSIAQLIDDLDSSKDIEIITKICTDIIESKISNARKDKLISTLKEKVKDSEYLLSFVNAWRIALLIRNENLSALLLSLETMINDPNLDGNFLERWLEFIYPKIKSKDIKSFIAVKFKYHPKITEKVKKSLF